MTWGQNFYTRCAKDELTAMPNLAALRAAVFLLSAKNRWGGGTYVPPPGRARVKGYDGDLKFLDFSYTFIGNVAPNF